MSDLIVRRNRRTARPEGATVFFVVLFPFLALTTAIGADVARKTRGAGEGMQTAAAKNSEEDEKRAREGTKIETSGYFQSTGDRVTFYSEAGKVRYRGLENLMLERIARAIEDNPGQLEWSVTGIVTEYRGANFILVTHATFKATDGR